MSRKRRSKSEIRAWLKTPAGEAWLEAKIAAKNVGKSQRRKLEAMAEMQNRGLHVECSQCLHGIGDHCPWKLPDGCEDYLEVHTGRTLDVR